MKVTDPGSVFDIAQLELVEQGVGRFANELRREVVGQHPYTQAAIGSYIDVLNAGGKRTRGMLTLCGYEMYGGEDTTMISDAAGAIEGFHASLLVIDDVADNADTRRGKPAAHISLNDYLLANGAEGDTRKTATDMAITAAVMAQNQGQVTLMGLEAPAERKIHAVSSVNTHLARTGMGQILDLASTKTSLTDEEVTDVAVYKTALYSFQMPLEAGALLAGAPKTSSKELAEYSLHSGIAFQLFDDVMGTFGDEAKMGKSAKSDLMEGKQTLLVSEALRRADNVQRKVLESALGDQGLSDTDFELCKEILVSTGALDATQQQASYHVEQANAVLDNAPEEWSDKSVAFLRSIAAFAIHRSV